MAENSLAIPKNYWSKLNIIETEQAIKLVKDCFERSLSQNLCLTRVSAPLFVRPETGLNDNLNGVERPVEFDIKDIHCDVQIVQSLAKWKRLALKRYGFAPGNGLYTDMNAIRRDELPDNCHSVYVDQWDWEIIITEHTKNTETLKHAVHGIVEALKHTQCELCAKFPQLNPFLKNEEVTFISSQELEDLYPNLSPKEREDKICAEKKIVFVLNIGGKLNSGKPHDGRAPDYDDWENNGDLLIWYPVLNQAMELSSMGIRVDSDTLKAQLEIAGCEDRAELPFHKMVLENHLPLTMGGGIGQSRICMVLLEKAHIGEVQASVWPEKMLAACAENGITIL